MVAAVGSALATGGRGAQLVEPAAATRAAREARMRPPRVSVLVPARDEAATIGHCLTSVARQVEVADLEIVVLDDRSSDGTATSSPTTSTTRACVWSTVRRTAGGLARQDLGVPPARRAGVR